MNTSLTTDETHSLDGNEVQDVNSAATGLSAPITSAEVARQIKAATDPLAKPLEVLCDLMREPRRNRTRRDGGTSALTQGSSRAHGKRYESTVILLIEQNRE